MAATAWLNRDLAAPNPPTEAITSLNMF